MSTLVSERSPITTPQLRDRVPAQRATPRTPATPAAAAPSLPSGGAAREPDSPLYRRRCSSGTTAASCAANSEASMRGCSATSASMPAPSTTRCASGSGSPRAIGGIDRGGGRRRLNRCRRGGGRACHPGNSAGFGRQSLSGHTSSVEISNAQAHPDRRDRDHVVIGLLRQSEPGLQRTAAGNDRPAERAGARSKG